MITRYEVVVTKIRMVDHDVLGDGIGKVELLDDMGGDQAIVNRARKCYQSQDRSTPESDRRLMDKLVGGKPLHGTTLRNTVFTFDVVAPLYVVRQWTRHLVGHDTDGNDVWHTGYESFDFGGAFDEQSLRYTETMKYYVPPYFDDMKRAAWVDMHENQKRDYRELRDEYDMDKQLARCALGPGFYSQFETTMNAQGLLDWWSKRQPGGGAQRETIAYANVVYEMVKEIAPWVIKAYEKANQKGG